jgi:hypothetical protein
MSNIANNIDDTFIIELGNSVTGIYSLSSYTDGTIGETVNRYFEREFRYTLDGINWTLWEPLTDLALNNIAIQATFDFNIQFRYTRKGLSGGSLQWCWINVEAKYNHLIECGVAFHNSIFSYFFNCCCEEDVNEWCMNVLRKLYEPGIIAQAMTRGTNENANSEDRDYIDFWRSITCYFALFVAYARKFESIQEHQLLLEKYINTKGLFTATNQPLEELQFLMSTHYKQMRERGTILMTSKKELDLGGAIVRVDGELLRTMSYNEAKDEFLFALTNESTCGWTMNMHSPLYKGIQNQPSLNKQYEFDFSGVLADTFPLTNALQSTYILAVDGSKAIQISQVPGAKNGIGFVGVVPEEFLTNVNPEIPYELTFDVQVTDAYSTALTVIIHGFDSANNPAILETIDITTTGDTAIEKARFTKDYTWYSVRVIIYPYTQPYVATDDIILTSLNVGSNLKFSINTAKIIPEVTQDDSANDSVGELFVKNFAVKPLRTDYGKGFVGGQSLVEVWAKNNSVQYSNKEIERFINNYMVPYKSGSVVNFM